MDELKPCPFCMSDNIRVLSMPGRDEYDPLYNTSVRCSDCGAGIVRRSNKSVDRAFHAAVEAWNRRAHGGTKYMEG